MISKNTKKGLKILVEVLEKDPHCLIKWPDAAMRKHFANCYRSRYPSLPEGVDIIGCLDGFRVPSFSTADEDKQVAYYNGKYGHNIGSLIVGGPDGCVFWYSVNYPGSMHDANFSDKLYNLILNNESNVMAANEYLIGDAAFRSGEAKIYLTTQSKRKYTKQEEYALASVRVSAEWQVLAAKHSQRLNMPFLIDKHEEKNRQTLKFALFISNFRARFCDISETKKAFWFSEEEDIALRSQGLGSAISPSSH
jgi:hypothetical protein